jgi:hypothetical protein
VKLFAISRVIEHGKSAAQAGRANRQKSDNLHHTPPKERRIPHTSAPEAEAERLIKATDCRRDATMVLL